MLRPLEINIWPFLNLQLGHGVGDITHNQPQWIPHFSKFIWNQIKYFIIHCSFMKHNRGVSQESLHTYCQDCSGLCIVNGMPGLVWMLPFGYQFLLWDVCTKLMQIDRDTPLDILTLNGRIIVHKYLIIITLVMWVDQIKGVTYICLKSICCKLGTSRDMYCKKMHQELDIVQETFSEISCYHVIMQTNQYMWEAR